MKYILASTIIIAGFIPLLCSPTHNTIDLAFFLFTIVSAFILMFFLYKTKKRRAKEGNDIKNQNPKDKT